MDEKCLGCLLQGHIHTCLEHTPLEALLYQMLQHWKPYHPRTFDSTVKEVAKGLSPRDTYLHRQRPAL